MWPSGFFWAVVVVLSAANLLIRLVLSGTQSPIMGAFVSGMLLGELNWLAVWAVMAPTAWPMRLAETIAGTVSLAGSLAAGIVIGAKGMPSGFGVLGHNAFLLPLVLVAGQSPFWLVRLALGWRIRSMDLRHTQAPYGDSRRFSLIHLFVATAVLAASLAAGRASSIPASGLLLLLIAAALLSVVTGLPCVFSGMVIADATRATLVVIAYVFALSAFVGIIVALMHGPFWESFWFSCCFGSGLAAVLHGGLRLMHAFGFAIETRDARERASVSG